MEINALVSIAQSLINSVIENTQLLVTSIALAITAYQVSKLREQVGCAVVSHQIEAVERFVHNRYVEKGTIGGPIIIKNDAGDRVIDNLRAARVQALKRATGKDNEIKEWKENSDYSKYAGGDSPWENKAAYQIAQALQDIGEAVLMGIVPLQYALTVLGDQFIDDWLVCKHWVTTYRIAQRVSLPEDSTTRDKNESMRNVKLYAYHRRHAEWLGILSAFWMEYRGFNYSRTTDLFDLYKTPGEGFDIHKAKRNALTRLEAISEVDAGMMSASVKKEVDKILKWAHAKY